MAESEAAMTVLPKGSFTGQELVAEMIFRLARHHRETCPGETCDVTLSLLIAHVEGLLDRSLTKEELGVFI